MKILFGVQTTGNGHISCSRIVVSALKAAGHEVTVLFSGANRSAFWDNADFAPYSQKRGLTFATDPTGVSNLKTFFQCHPLELIGDIRSLDTRPFDVVISNFEPITAWAAKLQNRPCIGLSHQAAFQFNIPKCSGDPLARLVLKHYAPTQLHLGLHWASFGQALLPPVVDHALLNDAPTATSHGRARSIRNRGVVLVCLPFEHTGHVSALLQRFNSHQFHLYADVKTPLHRGNVTVLPFDRAGFVADLRACEGVICHAGFELPSEALHLGKKLLVRPLGRHFEQQSNALALTGQGAARSMPTVQAKAIASFLDSPARAPKRYPDVAGAIARWLPTADLRAPNAQAGLAEELWRDTA